MSSLATNPLKGMLDFPPSVMREYLQIKKVIDGTVLAMGFEEYSLPVLESMDTFAVKSSNEILREQSYFFQDRGGREVILRPEITPSLARLVSKEPPRVTPLRWFTIGACYRYERPQKGRLREFLQLNCDILGENHSVYDLEIFKVSLQLLSNFGFKEEQFVLQYNHRGFVELILNQMSFSDEEKKGFFQLIDRKNKMSAKDFSVKVRELVADNEKKINFIDLYLATTSPQFLKKQLLSEFPNQFANIFDETNDNSDFDQVKKFLQLSKFAEKLSSSVQYSPTIVRGFDYYTGVVFEVFGTNGEIRRSLFGGGRYDRLTSAYNKKNALSGVGFGMGIYIFSLYLKSLGLLLTSSLKKEGYYLAPLKGDNHDDILVYTQALSQQLLAKKIANVVHPPNSIKKHLQTAEKLGYTEVALIGEDEMKTQTYQLKNLVTSEQKTIQANP